jgi:hypothetical protein
VANPARSPAQKRRPAHFHYPLTSNITVPPPLSGCTAIARPPHSRPLRARRRPVVTAHLRPHPDTRIRAPPTPLLICGALPRPLHPPRSRSHKRLGHGRTRRTHTHPTHNGAVQSPSISHTSPQRRIQFLTLTASAPNCSHSSDSGADPNPHPHPSATPSSPRRASPGSALLV